MKIIFVIPNLASGGAERVISNLANEFVKQNIAVDIVLLQDKSICYKLCDEVNIVYFNSNLLLCSKKIAYKTLRDYFKIQKRDCNKLIIIPFLDTCLKRVLLSTLGLNIPIIASERNDPYQNGIDVISRIRANVPYLMSTRCVFQTFKAKEYYCNSVRKKSDIIMNPIEISESLIWKGQESKRIVTVGRLEEQKNHMLLINAFARFHKEYPEYILEIYGEGSLKEKIQTRIDELSLNKVVNLCGYSSDILKILENSLLFVLSSDYEGMSNALIEALSMGMPVISTNHPCGGAEMIINDGLNGILVPVKDEIALVDAMKRIVVDEKFSLKIAENAFKIREFLSVQRIANEWLLMLNKL